ncbi:hypothetical protein EVAR_100221_1 [Eumeta japonica]|uniref:Uncharacterized protein n=1 Tax=Eumeta variegata TaxID=151549 RepID=A0A4C1ZHE6_EUMVA|nr:hypothetical protein EVAR_100221_1 [Eumeta japonica]
MRWLRELCNWPRRDFKRRMRLEAPCLTIFPVTVNLDAESIRPRSFMSRGKFLSEIQLSIGSRRTSGEQAFIAGKISKHKEINSVTLNDHAASPQPSPSVLRSFVSAEHKAAAAAGTNALLQKRRLAERTAESQRTATIDLLQRLPMATFCSDANAIHVPTAQKMPAFATVARWTPLRRH